MRLAHNDMKEVMLEAVWPIMAVEHDAIVSKQGDITIAYKVTLPELFSLSDAEYEALHHAWVKAVKVLPAHSIFHKQDWFIASSFQPNFSNGDPSFLSHCSEKHFFERPYLGHTCFIYLTKKPPGRKNSSSLLSTLVRRSIVPHGLLNPRFLEDFLNSCGQFKQILEDTGIINLQRLSQNEISSSTKMPGLLERYCYLLEGNEHTVKDIRLEDGIQVGNSHCQLYSLADATNLPTFCGSRINYDKYSTDRTKFSVGFAAPLGHLLPCNHIYNQFLFIEEAQKTITRLESKKLRLQSLSAY